MSHTLLVHHWQRLPLWLRIRLAHGSVGSVHRLRCAADAMTRSGTHPDAAPSARSAAEQRGDLLRTGRELLLAAWEDDPCNGQLAGQVLLLHQRMPWLHPALAALLAAVRDAWRRPADLARYQRLAGQADWPRLQRHVDTERERDPGNLFWLQQAVAAGELSGDLPWLEGHLERAFASSAGSASALAPLLAHLAGCLSVNRAAGASGAAENDAPDAPNATGTTGTNAADRLHAMALARFREAARGVSGLPGQPGQSGQQNMPGAGCWLAPVEYAAHCLARLGDTAAALPLWDAVLRARPWHTSLALRAHDAWQGESAPEAAPAGSTAVLLYSWNKAAELDATLTHLAPSLPDVAHVALLDNGSTDGTGDVVRRWAEAFGQDRCTAHHLPVNVGAAAARNWLMQLPQVAACDFAAYLDDDAAVPTHWLRNLATAVRRQPEASAWGGRTLDWHAPHIIQSADLHLTAHFRAPQGIPPELAPFADDFPSDAGNGPDAPDTADTPDAATAFSPARAHALPFSVSDLHAQVTDMGRFDYLRPCISVTGCCHLFRTADLRQAGGFALSLSPSQYDDLEHDLRQARAGRMACYTGFLPVRHMKRTGKAARMGGAQFGNGLGNRYKLTGMFDAADILDMRRREFDALERDLLRKMAALGARAKS